MPTVQCLFCQHLNPSHAAFCNECGQALKLRPCPQCQASNERNATICQRCGGELPAPEWLTPGATASSGSGEASTLWSHTRDGGIQSAVLSEMEATTHSARRRMFLAVAALLVALIAYGASVYFYGLPAQRPASQLQTQTQTEPQSQAQPAASAMAPAVPAQALRSTGTEPSAVTAHEASSPKAPELSPAAALGLFDEAPASAPAPSSTSSPTSLSAPSPALATCPPAVAALGLCQPSSSPPPTRQETP